MKGTVFRLHTEKWEGLLFSFKIYHYIDSLKPMMITCYSKCRLKARPDAHFSQYETEASYKKNILTLFSILLLAEIQVGLTLSLIYVCSNSYPGGLFLGVTQPN